MAKEQVFTLIAQTHYSNKIFSPIKFWELKNDCQGIPWPLALVLVQYTGIYSEGNLIIIVKKP